jgi:hypothetical protein
MNLASMPAPLSARTMLVITATIAVLAACSTPTPSASRGPLSSAAGGPTATIRPPTSFGPPPSPTAPDDATPVVLDTNLLTVLPAAIDGIEVKEDADAAAQALGDKTLPQIATAVDAAVAVDAGNGNLVYALVVRLRPGAFGDEAFRQWRDSYDQGACAAGGVAGNAEATLGGRRMFITSCVTGLRTYHVWLKEQGIVISASSIGADRFGEKLIAALQVPS